MHAKRDARFTSGLDTDRLAVACGAPVLTLYNFFQGSTSAKPNIVYGEDCGVTFATLALALHVDVAHPSVLTSILLMCARCEVAGNFLPALSTPKGGVSSAWHSRAVPGMPEPPLRILLLSCVKELQALRATPQEARDVARRMVKRRTESRAQPYRSWPLRARLRAMTNRLSDAFESRSGSHRGGNVGRQS